MSDFTHQVIILASSDAEELSYENYLIDGVTPINDQYSVNLFKANWTVIDLFKDFIDFYTKEYPDYEGNKKREEENHFEDFIKYYFKNRFNTNDSSLFDCIYLPYFSDHYCCRSLENIYIIPISILNEHKYLGY